MDFARCGKIAANAPMPAVTIPISAARMVGLLSRSPDEVVVVCTGTVVAGTLVTAGDRLADGDDTEALNGGSVPKTSVT